MRSLRLLASTSLIASISINFHSDEAVRVTTDRSGLTGNVPLHENRLAGSESVGRVRSRRCTGTLDRIVTDISLAPSTGCNRPQADRRRRLPIRLKAAVPRHHDECFPCEIAWSRIEYRRAEARSERLAESAAEHPYRNYDSAGTPLAGGSAAF
jgi:hypothetical protein